MQICHGGGGTFSATANKTCTTTTTITTIIIKLLLVLVIGNRDGTVVKVLCQNRKVAGSIPDGVIGIFHWHNPSDRTVALGSTQPLRQLSTSSIS